MSYLLVGTPSLGVVVRKETRSKDLELSSLFVISGQVKKLRKVILTQIHENHIKYNTWCLAVNVAR